MHAVRVVLNVRPRAPLRFARACGHYHRNFSTTSPHAAGHPLLEQAKLFLSQRKQKEALEAFRSVLTDDPDDSSAHANLAVLLQYVDTDEAQSHFARAVELGAAEDPDFAGQYASFLHVEQQDLHQANTFFQKATAHSKCSGMVHYMYGRFLMEQENFNSARQAFDRALELPATAIQLRLYCTHGALLADQFKEVDLAEMSFQHALALNAEDVEANIRYANLLHAHKKDSESAIRHFARAIRQNATVTTPMLADCLHSTMPNDKAYSQFEEIVRQNESESPIILAFHCYAMHLLQTKGDLHGAELFFQKCCDIPVEDSKLIPQIYAQMVLNYAIFSARETRNTERATQLLEYVKSVVPDIPAEIISQANGHIQAAIKERQEAINKALHSTHAP